MDIVLADEETATADATGSPWWPAYEFARTTMNASRPTAGAWADHILSLTPAQAPQSATDPAAYFHWFNETAELGRQLLQDRRGEDR